MTPLQAKIYDFVEEYLLQHPFSPSFSEIAQGIGISPNSVSLVSRNVHALVKAGKLNFAKKGYRNLAVGPNKRFTLPLVGRIAAGVPIEAIEDNRLMEFGTLLDPNEHFLLEVKGDSMIDEGILEGDFIICKQTNTAKEGDIVVVLIDEKEATLKKLSYHIRNHITLIPANTRLKPKAYLPHRVHIQGIFIGLFRIHH